MQSFSHLDCFLYVEMCVPMYPNFERDYLRNMFFLNMHLLSPVSFSRALHNCLKLATVYLDSMLLKTTKRLSGKHDVVFTLRVTNGIFHLRFCIFAYSKTKKSLKKVFRKKKQLGGFYKGCLE